MKELLSLLPRPSHYIGTEEGSVHKEPASVRLHCALAFPDLYEVGMSYLGHKILYTILNNREDIFAERSVRPLPGNRQAPPRTRRQPRHAGKRHGHREDAHVRVRDHT